ncbi:hypothetical protein FOMPIDRAFT_93135 [Fomitopsis schrenkii]|uniref:Uncharacterized protein n=1 Tax=Fomitopsis schrenkii TaxID=2126942 RepID=S8DSL4_FOMSC|nr:hypothetical protein FOMPIDRAFT_93135 [Fomitopsis schrenkii]
MDPLDWKRHKRFRVAAGGVEPRPIIMVDTILLPVDATQPRMIKLACAVQRDEDAELPDIVHRWDKNVYSTGSRMPCEVSYQAAAALLGFWGQGTSLISSTTTVPSSTALP